MSEPEAGVRCRVGSEGRISLALYIAAIPLAFQRTWIAHAIYIAVALIWLAPGRRIEGKVGRGDPAVH